MAGWPQLAPLIESAGRPLVVEALRAWAGARRGSPDVADPTACARWCEARLAGLVGPSQRRGFNPPRTGVPTKLGPPLLAPEAVEGAGRGPRPPPPPGNKPAARARGERARPNA